MNNVRRSRKPGFTLIELIVVISIIVVLAGMLFVAVDPVRRLHTARNAKRWSHAEAILKAIVTYQADHGELPPTANGIDEDDTTRQIIAKDGAVPCSTTCNGPTLPVSYCLADGLYTDLVHYLRVMPRDPVTGTEDVSRYYVNRKAEFIIVGACDPEGEGFGGTSDPPVIEVSQ